ncbi:acetyl-CoA carboxylase biotin carboxyl carrier protein subunit [Neolewinella lacunae]|uniref:Acetyl-CoA carboxylase biotin carboxyl carrier protein subunit n=1 Tax=Neolewinella lacunae TaxID=1517758 RepID=A0A923PL67_9BACT|nr:acetyl-CoA carboxylase biotin carboxyl carrier protein subunit [Neolewinella lacunae]MBC6994565.1 acetyl-CoA carboxylase biotin carboxyl carrier protein subunit [Neolewinella lacunae]MDN3633914.1 acetyl-CoA carboxylase biotin carboxyl carrier protein subunit [Neolewinella lacunae]
MHTPRYQVSVNDRDFAITDADLAGLDLVPAADGTYHLLRAGKSFRIEVVRSDLSRKTITLRVNGREQNHHLADATDQLVRQLGFSAVESQKGSDVFAPMPGLVLDVLVAPGDTVSPGTTLVILEAMKMENVLKAEGEGTVTAVKIAKGEAVEKRQLLIEITPA